MAIERAPEYTPNELMVCRAARELADGEVVFVGIGLPNLACNLARRLHAPNLALLYEAGRGVQKNLREAYRWFALAANAGDASAREKQVEIEARLKAGERSGLDREVSGFQPGAPAPADLAAVIPPAVTLAETQALLARKGYYLGPVDGVASPAFRSAATAYLRDHPDLALRP